VSSTGLWLDVQRGGSTVVARSTREAINHHKGAILWLTGSISLTRGDDAIVLRVVDDGTGFDLAEMEVSGGCGVAGMRERAGLVGGEIEFHSRPGQGAEVVLRIAYRC